jgi:hypothetical protein
MKKYTNTGKRYSFRFWAGMTELGQRNVVALCADLIGL